MFKTISAAVLAVSVIAAPAFAAGKVAAPATKSVQAPVIERTQVKNEQAKNGQVKTGVLNANAKMGRHHYKLTRHHRHTKMSALNTQGKVSLKPVTKSHSKVSFKHAAAAKRG